MKRLLKGGRVVDPANGRDGIFDILIDGDRIARVGKDLPVDGAHGRRRAGGIRRHARPVRHARAPARARPGAQGNGRDRHGGGRGRRIHGGRVHAEHVADQRQRRRHRVHPAEGGAGEPGARLSDRRGVEGIERRSARRHRRAARGRLRRHFRRRAAGEDGAADAAGARVRGHVQHAGARALRRSVAERRRRGARGISRVDARPARHSGRGRVDHGAARHRAGRDDRRGGAHLPHERRRRRCARCAKASSTARASRARWRRITSR